MPTCSLSFWFLTSKHIYNTYIQHNKVNSTNNMNIVPMTIKLSCGFSLFRLIDRRILKHRSRNATDLDLKSGREMKGTSKCCTYIYIVIISISQTPRQISLIALSILIDHKLNFVNSIYIYIIFLDLYKIKSARHDKQS